MIVIVGRSSADKVDRHLILMPYPEGETEVEVANPERTSGCKMLVSTAELRALAKQGNSVFGTINGHSPTGPSAQMIVKETDDPGIVGVYVCPIEWDEGGEAIEKNGGWAIRIRMIDWQRFLDNIK